MFLILSCGGMSVNNSFRLRAEFKNGVPLSKCRTAATTMTRFGCKLDED